MKEPTLYFAYGSNLDPDGMRHRAPNAVPVRTAILRDWRLTFRGVADIEHSPGDIVVGGLWLLDEEAEWAIDRYEGAPRFYEKRNVLVQETDGHGAMVAMTYTMCEDMRGEVGLPSPGYLSTISQGYQAFNLPMTRLHGALERVRTEHEALGVKAYAPRGEKRMMAVIRKVGETQDAVSTDGMSPATRRLHDLEEAHAA